MTAYESAKARYEALGVDVDAALAALADKAISIHCWQGDDVSGFETADGALSGGLAYEAFRPPATIPARPVPPKSSWWISKRPSASSPAKSASICTPAMP